MLGFYLPNCAWGWAAHSHPKCARDSIKFH